MSRKTGVFQVSTAQVVAGDGAQAAAPVPSEGYDECSVYVNVTAIGTSVTPRLQVSPDGTNWYDHGGATFTAITANGQHVRHFRDIGKHARVFYGAVTGSHTLDAFIVAKKNAN